MMRKEMLYTEEGYKSLVDELEYLKNVRRPEIKNNLAVARSYGDLSENSEYDEAKNEQAKIESRITELEDLIIHAKVVSESDIAADTVNVGSLVKLQNRKTKEELEYRLVGSNEANPLLGKISDQSPIGSALIGARKDQTVVVHAPCGEIEYVILEVSRAKSLEK